MAELRMHSIPQHHRRRVSGTLLAIAFLVACAAGQPDRQKRAVQVEVRVHKKAEWLAYRGEAWGSTLVQSMERDQKFGMDAPPPSDFWDEQVATESATIWRLLCNECHPGKRRISTAREIPPPGPGWGRGQGKFFGRVRPYREMFRQVSIGGAAKPETNSRMPGFGQELSNEQMWGLVYFIEHSSKKR